MNIQAAVLGKAENPRWDEETKRNSNDKVYRTLSRYWRLQAIKTWSLYKPAQDLTVHLVNVSIWCKGSFKSLATAAMGTWEGLVGSSETRR